MWGAIRAQERMRSCSTVPHTLNRANDSSQALSSYEYASCVPLACTRKEQTGVRSCQKTGSFGAENVQACGRLDGTAHGSFEQQIIAVTNPNPSVRSDPVMSLTEVSQ
jgi:hypothetical protein